MVTVRVGWRVRRVPDDLHNYCTTGSSADREKLKEYGFAYQPGKRWFYPPDLRVQGKQVNDLLLAIPSAYRRESLNAPGRAAGKSRFEKHLLDTLVELNADIVVLDGLLIILDELVRRARRSIARS